MKASAIFHHEKDVKISEKRSHCAQQPTRVGTQTPLTRRSKGQSIFNLQPHSTCRYHATCDVIIYSPTILICFYAPVQVGFAAPRACEARQTLVGIHTRPQGETSERGTIFAMVKIPLQNKRFFMYWGFPLHSAAPLHPPLGRKSKSEFSPS